MEIPFGSNLLPFYTLMLLQAALKAPSTDLANDIHCPVDSMVLFKVH